LKRPIDVGTFKRAVRLCVVVLCLENLANNRALYGSHRCLLEVWAKQRNMINRLLLYQNQIIHLNAGVDYNYRYRTNCNRRTLTIHLDTGIQLDPIHRTECNDRRIELFIWILMSSLNPDLKQLAIEEYQTYR
jgi:hypothetical protein